jgi:hypothetical protein
MGKRARETAALDQFAAAAIEQRKTACQLREQFTMRRAFVQLGKKMRLLDAVIVGAVNLVAEGGPLRWNDDMLSVHLPDALQLVRKLYGEVTLDMLDAAAKRVLHTYDDYRDFCFEVVCQDELYYVLRITLRK